MALLKSFTIRHALSTGMVVFVAVFIDMYFSFSHAYWVSLTALLVCQSTRGAKTRRGMIFFLIAMLALMSAALLKAVVFEQTLIYFILSFIFFVGGYFIYLHRLLLNKTIPFVLFLLIIFIAGLPSWSQPHVVLSNILLDMFMGAIIGILGSQFIFPSKIYEEFRQGIVPILKAMSDYISLLNTYLVNAEDDLNKLIWAKITIQEHLQIQTGIYPEWVYEAGFNPNLRAGYRFFLIHLEWMAEIFFSINYLISRKMDSNLIAPISDSFLLVMKKNKELLGFLIEYFNNEKIHDTLSDFKTDMTDLENIVKKNVPVSLELLDVSPDTVALTSLFQSTKDLRTLLLQLITALPARGVPFTLP